MVNTWPLQSDRAAMIERFGNPDANGDGAPDPKWVAEHLTTIVPPYTMFYGQTPIKRITCNKAIATPLLLSLAGILKLYGNENEIRRHGMHNFSGCYNFRPKRGGSSLSMHAYGAAVDLDAANNAFHSTKFTMPAAVVDIFESNGAVWGGHWISPDAMHFQWARVK